MGEKLSEPRGEVNQMTGVGKTLCLYKDQARAYTMAA